MRKKSIAAIGVAAAILAAVGTATPALADTSCSSSHFCAWSEPSYGGTKLLDTSGVKSNNQYIDVADDAVDSGKNRYSATLFCGWSNGSIFGDVLIFQWAYLTNATIGSGGYDQIDYFRARTSSPGC